jgi:tetratricopeptide (TPR) repeat protein
MGQRPFHAEYASAVIYRIVNDDPSDMDQLEARFGRETATLIARCLSKDPRQRPAASELGDLLEPSVAVPVRPTSPRVASKPTLYYVGAALGVVGLILVVLLVLRGSSGPDWKDATLAVIPAVIEDEASQATFNGLISATSKAAKQVVEDRGLARHVVSSDSVAKYGIATPQSASDYFGVSHVVTAGLTADRTKLALTLQRADNGHQLVDRQVPMHWNDMRSTFENAVLATAQMLGLPDTVRLEFEDPFSRTEPGVFDIYASAIGLIEGQQSERAIRTGIEMLERVDSVSSDVAVVHAGLAKGYLNLYHQVFDPDLLEVAEDHADRAIELDGDLTDAYLTYGKVYVRTGRPGMAKRILEMATEGESPPVEALLTLADVYAMEGDLANAEATYLRAEQLEPGYWDVYRRTGLFYYYQSRYEEAIDQFEHLIELSPMNSKGYLNLGAAHYLNGDVEIADRYWQEGMAQNPNDHQLFLNLGGLYFYSGNYPRAAQAYERAVELTETDYLVWGNLGTAYLWSGSDPDLYLRTKQTAIRMAEATLESNPNDEPARSKLAGYHAEMGDTESARRYLDHFGTEPSDFHANDILFEVGVAWEEIGERDAALAWLRQALLNGYPTEALERYPPLEDIRKDPRFLRIQQELEDMQTEEVG